jgi:hypothetical protein
MPLDEVIITKAISDINDAIAGARPAGMALNAVSGGL